MRGSSRAGGANVNRGSQSPSLALGEPRLDGQDHVGVAAHAVRHRRALKPVIPSSSGCSS